MTVNVVRVLEDSDYRFPILAFATHHFFRYVKQLCDNHDGWDVAYQKKSTSVWMKAMEDSSLAMFKVDFNELFAVAKICRLVPSSTMCRRQ